MAQLEKAEVRVRVAEEVPVTEPVRDAEAFHFPEHLIVLAKHKSFIIKFVSVALILSVVATLLMSNTYTATAKILPLQQNQSMGAMAALSQLGPLAALAGQGMGLRSPSDIYVAMLRSETVANGLIDRFSLMSIYKEKLHVDARRDLSNQTEIAAGKDGVISISVEERNPQRAADLANGYVQELENLTKTLNVTEAGKRRLFFEREVKTENDNLADAEVALKLTQEKTGLILLDSQSRAMIESITSLRAGIAAQEVKVQAIRSFATTENPDLVVAEQELTAMRVQLDRLEHGQGKRSIADVPIENVPTAGLEYVRKLRDVKYHEALFQLLAKQYEAAKIDEARDSLIVQQMDKATLPERKSGPHRLVIVLTVTILAFLMACIVAFSMEAMERAKEDPQFSTRVSESTRVDQQQRLDEYVNDLDRTVQRTTAASAYLGDSTDAAAAKAAADAQQNLVEKMKGLKSTGRIVLEIKPTATVAEALPELVLEDGDRLLVPYHPATVGVIGSVYNNGAFVYRSGKTVADYLRLAGGAKKDGDKGREFVFRADGSTVSRQQHHGSISRSFDNLRLMPGDTIVVPQKIPRGATTRAAIRDWATILGQLGLAAGGIHALFP